MSVVTREREVNVQIFMTGGTIDKVYNPENGELQLNETQIPAMLERARVTGLEVELETLMLKDSLDMQAPDREVIARACEQTRQQRVLITHGTDTMVDTAQRLAQMTSSKTIVLLGAMIPYRVAGSDALFNLGAAMAAVQCLPAGVYIAMSGRVFPWDQVVKDRAAGAFVDA